MGPEPTVPCIYGSAQKLGSALLALDIQHTDGFRFVLGLAAGVICLYKHGQGHRPLAMRIGSIPFVNTHLLHAHG